MKKIFFILLLLSKFSFSQTLDTSNLQISIITCAPGNELYSIFGHTAIRVVDATNQSDIVFNYGTFDFEDPDFLMKFTLGKLDYFLSAEDGNQFFVSYQTEGRIVTEQVLQLTYSEKIAIQKALIENITGNNKFYKYDFLLDNCTTRVRELLKRTTTFVNKKQLVQQSTSFRKMLHIYLDSSGACWSKLGIDLLLGSKADKAVTIEQSCFLPDYLMFAIDSLNTSQNFVSNKKVYPATTVKVSRHSYLPTVIFSLFFAIVVLLFFSKNLIASKLFHFISVLLLFVTGIIGCLLLFMWLCTDHKSFANNYNLLWAIPTNIVAVFLVKKESTLKKIYFKTAFILTILLAVCWFFMPQQFNIALLPLALTMLFCYKRNL